MSLIISKNNDNILKKNNSITDAKNGFLSVPALKMLDLLLFHYEKTGKEYFEISLPDLRNRLKMDKNNNYRRAIELYLEELSQRFEIRNYRDRDNNQISWAIASFLNDPKIIFHKEDNKYICKIDLSKNFIDYMIDRAGFTLIPLNKILKFKTKYGYKTYEMYLRYQNVSQGDKDSVVIKKSMDELNAKYGTNHKYAWKMKEGINRGIEEIKKISDVFINCYYDKREKAFVFSWRREKKPIEKKSICIIPKSRVKELIEWYLSHKDLKINDLNSYKNKLRLAIVKNEFNELEEYYKGMLKNKYGLRDQDIEILKKDGVYKDFILEDGIRDDKKVKVLRIVND